MASSPTFLCEVVQFVDSHLLRSREDYLCEIIQGVDVHFADKRSRQFFVERMTVRSSVGQLPILTVILCFE